MSTALDTGITPITTTKIASLDVAGNCTVAEINSLTTQTDVGLANVDNTADVNKNVATAGALTVATTINGVPFDGSGPIVVTANAGTLSGATLKPTVTFSSLTSVGTIGTGVWQGTPVADTYIASGATWNAKLDSVDIGDLNTTGTPATTKYLNGDFEWAVPEGTGGGSNATTETSVWIDAGALFATDAAEASTITGTNGSVDEWLVNTTETLYAKLAMPPQWDGGDVDVEVLWTITGGTPGEKVAFEVAAHCAGEGDDWDAVFPAPVNTGDDVITADDNVHSITASTITAGGTPADGDILFLELTRVAAAVAVSSSTDVRILGVRLKYQNSLLQNWYSWKLGDETTEVTTGTKSTWVAPAAGKIHAVHSGATVAPVGSSITLDVEKTAVSILATNGVIAIGGDSTTDGTPHVLSGGPVAFAAGDNITFDIDIFGGTAAAGVHTDLLISWD